MSKKRVVILDREEAFGAQLMEYVKEHRRYGFELLLFTDEEALREYLLEVPLVHMLIAEPSLALDFDNKKIKKIYYISEEKEASEELFRYQPMKQIMEKICTALKDRDEKENPVLKAAGHELICVFSPVGGSGKTHISRQLARERGKASKTFLFPLELFSEGYKRDGCAGFSDLIYYLKQEDAGLLEKFSDMVFREESYYSINPSPSPMDYLYLEKKEIERLIKLLFDEEGYETLVFDLGFINEAVLRLFELADHVYVPEAVTDEGRSKMEFWKETLVFMGKDDILEKQEAVKQEGFFWTEKEKEN